jgi:choline dehydrogenase-like flavoprotein
MSAWNWKLLAILHFLALCLAQVPQTNYDVIVIRGGPSGLSAASALSRVLRKVVLFDSGKYRNNPTRHMHDVIGNDRTYLVASCSRRKLIESTNQMSSRLRSEQLPGSKSRSTI